MRPADKIKRLINKSDVTTSSETDKRILGDALEHLAKLKQRKLAETRPNNWRIIMKSSITKLAAAAAIIVAVLVGVHQFGGSINGTSVVWAEVARKVESSRSSIFRCTETSSDLPDEADYSISYNSPRYSRKDVYKGGQITHSYYKDFDTKTYTGVYHKHKHYLSITFTPSREGFLEKHEDWMDPRYLVQTILSCEHRKLGQKTIEGVLCEGIETTDPAVLGPLPEPVSRLEVQMRLWVNAKTEYPVLFESKITIGVDGKVLASEGVIDQFQWDVELDPSLFEPNIPPDYVSMKDL